MHARCYGGSMSKVIQFRDVPDRVHAALVEAAEAEGLSLTGYLQRELAWLADQPAISRHNMDVIRATRAKIHVVVDDQAINDALAEGRAER
jgi:hypothetical protein